MIKGGKLRSTGRIAKIFGKEGLRDLGFDIPVEGKVMAQQAFKLNRVEKEPPSTSDIVKADDIEFEEITQNAVKSTDDLIVRLKGESYKDLPMHELLGLDKQLRSIRGSLKVETVKKVWLQQCTE